MFDTGNTEAIDLALAQVRSVVAALDPARISGAQAVELLDRFAGLERLAAAGRALVARRAVETNQWRHGGDRSPEQWLANRTGTSYGAAKEALETADRLSALPSTEAAVRSGQLSPAQAAVVADAATADPAAEQELLAAAPHESLKELRTRGERVKAAAASAEEEERRRAAIHGNRAVREVSLADGSHELRVRGPREALARLRVRLQPYVNAEFRRARQEGRRESREAYAFDALMAMADDRAGTAPSPVKMLIRVDLPAVRRGWTEPGEVCEIPGYGPIPVSVALRHMNEAFLALLVTKGKDVVTVAHLGRQFTAQQQTALEWRDPECTVLGCSATVRLERDHREDWAETHVTRVPAADWLCHFHHSLKTTQGWRLEPGEGKRRLVPPPARILVSAGEVPP